MELNLDLLDQSEENANDFILLNKYVYDVLKMDKNWYFRVKNMLDKFLEWLDFMKVFNRVYIRREVFNEIIIKIHSKNGKRKKSKGRKKNWK